MATLTAKVVTVNARILAQAAVATFVIAGKVYEVWLDSPETVF